MWILRCTNWKEWTFVQGINFFAGMWCETLKSSGSQRVEQNISSCYEGILSPPPPPHNEIIINLSKCSLQRRLAAAGGSAAPSASSLRWAEAPRWPSCGLFSQRGRRRCQWPRPRRQDRQGWGGPTWQGMLLHGYYRGALLEHVL